MGFVVFNDSIPSTSHTKLSSKPISSKRTFGSLSESIGKENVDPFSNKSKLMNSKGKGLDSKVNMIKGGKRGGIVENGICTGELFTRILSTPEKLPKHYKTFTAKPITKTRTIGGGSKNDNLRNSVPFPVVAGLDSPNSVKSSAKDSGCWKSSEESDLELLSGTEESELEGEVTIVLDSDRLARSLTESPLAEITKAFTSFGNFSLPSSSSPIQQRDQSCLTGRIKPIEKKIYSQTTSTRKVKPTGASDSSGKALRCQFVTRE